MSSDNDSFLANLATHRLLLIARDHDKLAAHTEVLSSSLLSSSPVTSIELESQLQASTSNLVQAEQKLASKQESLIRNIDALMNTFKARNSELFNVPEEIEQSEDALMKTSTELTGLHSEDDPQTTMMQNLQSQHEALYQLYAARNYLSLLARAEDLKKKVAETEVIDTEKDSSLIILSELDMLCKKVQIMSGTNMEGLKANAFLESQRVEAFAQLVSIRRERLNLALTEASWPPAPVELNSNANTLQKAAESILLESIGLKKRWKQLMKLQRQSEKLQLLPICSAQMSLSSSKVSNRPQPGSKDYQPLLAIQCLFTPLLLRFYYHFDSSRSTNRLDKPEWYLTHMLNIVRSHAHLFDPLHGPVAILCGNKSSKTSTGTKWNLYAELLHAILRPLVQKIESSIPLLLQNSRLLSHTIMQVVQFDQDLCDLLPASSYSSPIHLAESLLSNEIVFEAWVQSERDFATERLEQELEGGSAWLVGEGEDVEDEGFQGSWAAMVQEGSNTIGETEDLDGINFGPKMKTTRSARAVVALLDGLRIRYKSLPAITHQLPFLLIQLSILQGYAQRLERSLDAFEGMSSAFSRAIPGAISIGDNTGPEAGINSEADMVRGLRGLGRLLKACLSAIFISRHLGNLSSTSFYLEIGSQARSNPEALKSLNQFKNWQGNEEEKELDKASLGELVRRGWRSGGRLASGVRPLGNQSLDGTSMSASKSITEEEDTTIDVWANMKSRFDAISKRAQSSIEKLVVSEVLEGIRSYSYL